MNTDETNNKQQRQQQLQQQRTKLQQHNNSNTNTLIHINTKQTPNNKQNNFKKNSKEGKFQSSVQCVVDFLLSIVNSSISSWQQMILLLQAG